MISKGSKNWNHNEAMTKEIYFLHCGNLNCLDLSLDPFQKEKEERNREGWFSLFLVLFLRFGNRVDDEKRKERKTFEEVSF